MLKVFPYGLWTPLHKCIKFMAGLNWLKANHGNVYAAKIKSNKINSKGREGIHVTPVRMLQAGERMLNRPTFSWQTKKAPAFLLEVGAHCGDTTKKALLWLAANWTSEGIHHGASLKDITKKANLYEKEALQVMWTQAIHYQLSKSPPVVKLKRARRYIALGTMLWGGTNSQPQQWLLRWWQSQSASSSFQCCREGCRKGTAVVRTPPTCCSTLNPSIGIWSGCKSPIEADTTLWEKQLAAHDNLQ